MSYKSYYELDAPPEPNVDQYAVPELSSELEKNQLISNVEFVCIDVYATWCGPCVNTAPQYAVLAKTYSKRGSVAIVKYDYDKMQPSEKKGITGIPVFNFYFRGSLVDQVIGGDIDAVETIIKKYVTQVGNEPMPSVSLPSGPQHSRSSIRNHSRGNGNVHPDATGGVPYKSPSNYYNQ